MKNQSNAPLARRRRQPMYLLQRSEQQTSILSPQSTRRNLIEILDEALNLINDVNTQLHLTPSPTTKEGQVDDKCDSNDGSASDAKDQFER